MKVRRLLFLVLLAVAAAMGPGVSDAAASHCSTLQATLTGPPINGATPSGRAEWRGTPACTGVELKVELRNVNLPNGTVLTLETCGTQWNVTLNNREMRFELKEGAPTCTVGTAITVRAGTTTVASGTWCNPLFSRCS